MEERNTNQRLPQKIQYIAIAFSLFAVLFTQSGLLAFEDADVLFNYMNNGVGARPFFAYNGYISAYPQVFAYIFSAFPLALQFFLYWLTPAIIIYFLFMEIFRQLSPKMDDLMALAITMVILLILHRIEPRVFSNLTYSIWPALIAACLYLNRLWVTNEKANLGGLVLLCALMLSHALSVLLVPIAIFVGLSRRENDQRRNISLVFVVPASAIVMLGLSAWSGSDVSGSWSLNPLPPLLHYARNFIDGSFKGNVMALFSVLVLCGFAAGGSWKSFAQKQKASGHLGKLILPYFGLGSLGLYMISPRFLGDAGFAPRYVLLAVTCTLVVLALAIVPVLGRKLNQHFHVVLRVFVLLGIFVLILGDFGRSPLASTNHKIQLSQFLLDGADFRRTCRAGEFMAFSSQYRLPVLFCHRQEFEPGMQALAFEHAQHPEDIDEIIVGRSHSPQVFGGNPIP